MPTLSPPTTFVHPLHTALHTLLDFRITEGTSRPRVGYGAKRGAGQTRALVADLARQDLRPRQIAGVLGISTQAVYQHLQSLRASGELAEEAAS